MKIATEYLKEKLTELLSGNVTYNDGAGFDGVVPVVASQALNNKYQIFIGAYSDADRSNSHAFGANASQVIEIIAKQATAAQKHVDAIGELANNLIMPTPTSSLLSGPDFHISVTRPTINHLTEDSGSGQKLVRLILRYNLLIHHN